jgi:hypothetical protein
MSYLPADGESLGGGTGTGSGVGDQLSQPLAVGLTPLAIYDASGDPVFTHETESTIKPAYGSEQVHTFHEGTGDGILCIHPPELQDYMLHGSGTNPDSRWPTSISEVTLLLHNCARADGSTGDTTKTYLAFGNPLKDTVKPKSGVYFEYDSSTGVLNIQHTDSSGADTTVSSGVTIDGSAIGGSGDVTAASNITDHAIVRGDVGAKGVQDTLLIIDDNNNLTTATSFGMVEQASKPLTAGAGTGYLWVKNDAPTNLRFVDDSDDDSAILLGKNNLSEVDDAATARSNIGAGTGDGDLLASNNLSDVASEDTSLANLIGGATSRTPVLSDFVGFYHPTGTGGYTTPQAVYNLVNSLTAETAPAYNDKIPLYDATASQTDAVTIANLISSGRLKTKTYAGTGSSGATVTLDGVNRAHFIIIANLTTSGTWPVLCIPNGGTGTVTSWLFANGVHNTVMSLGAQSAGTSQVLTLNTTAGNWNASSNTYVIMYAGTPT